MKSIKRIAIVGAGLGGLTAAIAMRKLGHEVLVFEQALQASEIGAGIVVGPNAGKVLRALELEAQLDRIAVEPDRHLLRDGLSGRVLFDQPMKGTFRDRFGAGYLQVHRADLVRILLEQIPESCLRFGARVTSVRNEQQQAVLTLADGSESAFDIIVGADGIKSAVRESLFGAESPRFTGNVCWRGTVSADALPAGLFSPDIHVWIGPGGHIVNYYLRGGKLVNFVAIHQATDWDAESWSFDADKGELGRTFEGWNKTLSTLFEHADRCSKWALFDRDPLPRWSVGAITLLGDAAHPMLPYLAQGAAMAMEDGFVLSRLLSEHDSVEVAIKHYEEVRKPRTSRTQLGARARAKQNHVKSPLSRLVRDASLALKRVLQPNSTSYKVEWLYEHDVTAELNRPENRGGLPV